MERKTKGKKWTTLEHNGVLFPPPYEPLPKNVKILYRGKPVDLPLSTQNEFNVSAEEAVVFFAWEIQRAEADPDKTKIHWVEDEVFVRNFWHDLQKILGPRSIIQDFNQIDFAPVVSYLHRIDQQNKGRSKEEKAEAKRLLEEQERPYKEAIMDGVSYTVGTYKVQPPALFKGHVSPDGKGGQPLRGRIKGRIKPEQIVLNGSTVPEEPIIGGRWKGIISDQTNTYLATYTQPVTGEPVHTYLSRVISPWVQESDQGKFDKARKLGENIEYVRQRYNTDLTSNNPKTRQLATATYLLDRLAVRPGADKDEETESNTVGLTTLKCSHLKFEPERVIAFNFVGKSSIVFERRVRMPDVVYNNLLGFCRGKPANTEVFPAVKDVDLNDYLKQILPDLTAKVFRTYKACSILQEKLFENLPDIQAPVYEKKLAYNEAATQAAIALNHKKTVASSGKQVEKNKAKLEEAMAELAAANTDKKRAAAEKKIKLAESKINEGEMQISTATSKTNYSDPRITVSWAKTTETPIEQLYTKQQLSRFVWAMGNESEWRF